MIEILRVTNLAATLMADLQSNYLVHDREHITDPSALQRIRAVAAHLRLGISHRQRRRGQPAHEHQPDVLAPFHVERSAPLAHDRRGHDEAWQGRMVAGIVGAALSAGFDRVIWHTLADPPENPRAPMRSPFSILLCACDVAYATRCVVSPTVLMLPPVTPSAKALMGVTLRSGFR